MSRRNTSELLHLATRYYLVKKGFSVHHEVGLSAWGRRRADVFAFNFKSEIIICEIKSCAADFDSDTKFHEYLDYAHRFYFVIDLPYWESKAADRLRLAAKEHGAGVLVLMNGRLSSKINVKARSTLPRGFLRQVITKLAWRGGNHRGNTRVPSRGVFP